MKKIVTALFSFLWVCFLISNCKSGKTSNQELIKSDITPRAVNKLTTGNEYIDFDYQELSSLLYSSKNPINPVAKAQYDTAVHRFYRHVKVVDNQYVCSLKNGSEIKVSERVFNALLESLNNRNKNCILLLFSFNIF